MVSIPKIINLVHKALLQFGFVRFGSYMWKINIKYLVIGVDGNSICIHFFLVDTPHKGTNNIFDTIKQKKKRKCYTSLKISKHNKITIKITISTIKSTSTIKITKIESLFTY